MNILVACEESQRVCKAFRDKGHNAFSCDLLPPSGDMPQYHIQGDVLPLLNGNCSFKTLDGEEHYIQGKWDFILAFPPCTYLTSAGNRWFNEERYGDKARERKKLREEAAQFFMAFVNADCEKIVIENPVGYMNKQYRKPDQIIQPYQFGTPISKKTCLWLKGVAPLKPSDIVSPEEDTFIYASTGKKDSKFRLETLHMNKEARARERSKTFIGVANAMANQWG